MAKGSNTTDNQVTQMLKNWKQQGLVAQIGRGYLQEDTVRESVNMSLVIMSQTDYVTHPSLRQEAIHTLPGLRQEPIHAGHEVVFV